jgi:pimeloyl-ACP methyl ester carboxylesterase
MQARLSITEQYLRTHDGWTLELRRTVSRDHFDPARAPLLIVPGYGMNNFIFSYHPRGTSMERCLAEAGFEVWSFNLRAQGGSRPSARRAGPVTLHAYATVDVPAMVAHVLASTRTERDCVTLVGASLGGTVSYSYLSLHADAPVNALVTMGSPLRWDDVHPLVKVAFASPTLAGRVKVTGARELLRRTMPALLKAPALLGFYMNTATIDMQHVSELVRTVEDPLPSINRDIAHWIKSRDLFVEGVNVTDAIGRLSLPLMVVLSNRDGIVPEAAAMSAAHAWGGEVDVLRVGDDTNWYAHANLFVANDARELVFTPMIDWLSRTAREGAPR